MARDDTSAAVVYRSGLTEETTHVPDPDRPDERGRLADMEPLTGRSPTPEYAVIPPSQLVVGDRAFCGEGGPLLPVAVERTERRRRQ